MQKKKGKSFIETFIFDVLFFLFIFALLAYSLKVFSPAMGEVKEFFSQPADMDNPEFAASFAEVSNASNQIYYGVYFIIPALFYLFYCFFQGLSFKRNFRYAAKFSLASLVPVFVFFLCFNNLFSVLWMNLLFIAVFYTAFVFYLNPELKKFWRKLADWRIALGYAGYLVLMLCIFCMMFMTYVGMKIGYGWIVFVILLLGMTALLSLLKKKLIDYA